MLEELIKTLGSTAIIVIAVAWFARSIAVHVLNRDIERFKSELRKEMLEHVVKFCRVDEKVADHLSELYAHLFKLYKVVLSYVKDIERPHEPSYEEKNKAVTEANKEFNDFLFPNRLYIPPKLYKRAQDLGGKLADIADACTRDLKRLSTEDEEDITEEADPLFSDLVAAFQKRIGVEDEQP